MQHPIKLKYLALAFIVTFECAVSAYLAFLMVRQRTSVKGAYVTRIPKALMDFPSTRKYLYFYEPKPNENIRDKPDWLAQEAVYTINADSLNERKDYPHQKGNDVTRILTIGDSFTFGQFVQTKDNYTERLEDMLNQQTDETKQYEVINLGMFGYDIAYTVERYRRRGIPYDADIVVWLINNHNLQHISEILEPRIDQARAEFPEEEKRKARATGDYYPAIKAVLDEFLRTYPREDILRYQEQQFDSFLALYPGRVILLTYDRLDPVHTDFLRLISVKAPRISLYVIPWYKSTQLYPDGHPNASGHAYLAGHAFDAILKSADTGGQP